MGLNIYTDDVETSLVNNTNRLSAEHDALNGSWTTKKIWLRNNDDTLYYTGVRVSVNIPGVTEAPNASPTGVIYQLVEGDIEPTVLEWKHIPYHNQINFPNIGDSLGADTSTYYPFWLRTYVPGNSKIGRIQEANLRIEALARAV